MPDFTKERFEKLRTCVIVPTYNNARTLGKLLDELIQYTSDIIVVNDGATDGTADILEQYSSLQHVVYKKNIGKGWALQCGFKKAVELGFQYAITIDSDGQHFPEDLPKFLDALEDFQKEKTERSTISLDSTNPGLLIIGKRDMAQAGIPGKSSFGNKFSNFWYWVETGIKMDDTQSGYRLYPVAKLNELKFFTRKFEFEIEVIVRAAWRGISVQSVPVKIFYEEKGKRVSHFRPFQDFSRISVLNTVLVTIALLYIKPRDFFRKLFRKGTRKALLVQLFHPDDSHLKKSLSVAFGVFMGIVPIWGFQLVTAIALSFVLRLNKALVIAAAHISIPPMIPVILFVSHYTGKFWMGSRATSISFSRDITIDHIRNSFQQYLFGAITLSVIAGIGTGLITFVMLKLFKRKPTIS
jgi:glycosyltransferase involved in cell wall biosynthesis